jgi:rare lipoprotein A
MGFSATRFSLASLLFLTLFLMSSCATSRGTATRGMTLEVGIASWYGPTFHGKSTANGETYNQNELTAAHKTLPFNTVVKVTNLDNGKSVTVRINDRGPYAGNRVIDLSRAAAAEIDMIGPGTAQVRLELVSSEVPIGRQIEPEMFTVQLASYTERRQAEDYARKIDGAYVQEALVNGVRYFRVFSGRFRDRDDAVRHQRALSRRNIEGFVKQVQN